MQYRLDKYGNRLSALGFGCMRFPQKMGRIDMEQTEQLLMAAIDGGVNYLDTAYIYPGSEAAVGEILEKNNARDRVYIATKLPHYLIKNEEGLEKLFQEELARLRTDHIDYYLMHMLTDPATWERLKKMNIEGWLAEKKKNGQITYFMIWKFRSMKMSTPDVPTHLLENPEQYITRVGKFIRKTSIDELPQLWNILKGDMSVVGPRPLLVQYLPLYNERQKLRHTVRPGLTGLAQVSGRNSLTWEQKFEDDVTYIENITFLGDIKIIFKTVISVLKREGISQENNATMEAFTGTPKENVNA